MSERSRDIDESEKSDYAGFLDKKLKTMIKQKNVSAI
jgi:hypothetical protein